MRVCIVTIYLHTITVSGGRVDGSTPHVHMHVDPIAIRF